MTFDSFIEVEYLKKFPYEKAKNVNYGFLWANRVLDTLKEALLIDFGLVNTSDFIHKLAHINLERLDTFGDILHQHHIKQDYPETPFLGDKINDVNKVLELAVRIIDETDKALGEFIDETKGGAFNAMSLSTEEIQTANSADKENVLKAWKMWSENVSPSSFDSWVKHLTGSGGEDAYEH